MRILRTKDRAIGTLIAIVLFLVAGSGVAWDIEIAVNTGATLSWYLGSDWQDRLESYTTFDTTASSLPVVRPTGAAGAALLWEDTWTIATEAVYAQLGGTLATTVNGERYTESIYVEYLEPRVLAGGRWTLPVFGHPIRVRFSAGVGMLVNLGAVRVVTSRGDSSLDHVYPAAAFSPLVPSVGARASVGFPLGPGHLEVLVGYWFAVGRIDPSLSTRIQTVRSSLGYALSISSLLSMLAE